MKNPQIPKGTPVKDEDKIYYDLLKEIEKTQISTIDESGKRLIDRSAAILGVFMTIIALSKEFPPPYLLSDPKTIPLAIAMLTLVIISQLSGFLLLMPGKYKLFQYNLTENEKEYKKIRKKRSVSLILEALVFSLPWFF